tara:strand:- start:1542 stop:2702 length:1161 start_codon:yes stop_codon:yes gene_type:complete
MAKFISILGSTGSVGVSALKIIEKKKNFFKVNLLSANKNYNLICRQIRKYNPNYFLIFDKQVYQKVKIRFKKKKIKIINSLDRKHFINKSDITISAITGIAGLKPTIYFIKKSKKVLIANKESIICGWELIQTYSKKFKTKIISIDSEHYSIMKLIENHKLNEIKKIYITASGGPFLNYNLSKLKKIKPHEALKHPNWRMGKKISIDSATLMNKIFEIVEAQKLFSIPDKKIDILIHPNSLVHAIIYLKNGLVKFLYHETSMIIPLANAIFDGNLNIDNFYNNNNSKSIIAESLTFKKVDEKKFPLIKLKKKINEYPATALIINAANEVLVSEFLKKKIPYMNIYRQIFSIMNDRNYRKYAIKKPKTLKEIFKIDSWAKATIKNKI